MEVIDQIRSIRHRWFSFQLARVCWQVAADAAETETGLAISWSHARPLFPVHVHRFFSPWSLGGSNHPIGSCDHRRSAFSPHPFSRQPPTTIMLLVGWLLVALGAKCTWGSGLPEDERCVTAVYSAYNYISFTGTPAVGMWDTRCRNPLKVASIYAASEVYCHEGERATGLAQLAAFCEEFGHFQLLSRKAVAENITEDAIRNMRTVNYLELLRTDPVDTPVLLSESYFNRMFNTIVSLPATVKRMRKRLIKIRIPGNSKVGHIMHSGKNATNSRPIMLYIHIC